SRAEAPGGPANRVAKKGVHRQPAGAGEREAKSRRAEHEVVFVAAAGHEEAVLEMNGDHGNQHHRGYERRTQSGQESQRQEKSAAELDQSGHQRVAPARAKSECLEKLAGSVQPVAAEPSKQLLRSVSRE